MNVHLGIFTMALATGTTMSGFFGMNLISGLEQAQYAFPIVVAMSTFTGGALALSSLNYLSGRTMQKRAESRLKEVETLNSALSDMGALDYTVSFLLSLYSTAFHQMHSHAFQPAAQLKTSVGKGEAITKEDFRFRLRHARESRTVSQQEVDLLFPVFDVVKDGLLTLEDFSSDEASRFDRDKEKEKYHIATAPPL